MARLSIQLDGKPVFLYLFSRGRNGIDKFLCAHVCAHEEFLLPEEIRKRVLVTALEHPEKISFGCAVEGPDLFERSLSSAGFVFIEDDILVGLILPHLSPVVDERDMLMKELERK